MADNRALIANTQTMLDNGALFSNTDISRVLSALIVAERELETKQAFNEREWMRNHATSQLGQKVTAAMFDEMGQAPEPDTDPHLFMTANNLDQTEFRAALAEYRNLDTGYMGSPWAMDEIGVLAADFINWYRWERL